MSGGRGAGRTDESVAVTEGVSCDLELSRREDPRFRQADIQGQRGVPLSIVAEIESLKDADPKEWRIYGLDEIDVNEARSTTAGMKSTPWLSQRAWSDIAWTSATPTTGAPSSRLRMERRLRSR